MTVQVLYQNSKLNKSSANLVLFVEENFNISSLKKHILNTEFSAWLKNHLSWYT